MNRINLWHLSLVIFFWISIAESNVRVEFPQAVRKIVESNFPGYQLPTDESHYVCKGDFDGNGLEDVAILLVSKKAWKGVAFHQLRDQVYEAFILGNLPGNDQKFVRTHPVQNFKLVMTPKGEKMKVDGKILRLGSPPLDAISLVELKAGVSVLQYRWSSKTKTYLTVSYVNDQSSFAD